MSVIPKKTYSRINNKSCLSGREKENVDPFDKLLSSPLKPDLQFKPLSFWERKVKTSESSKKSKSFKWELYETSNSDDNSPRSRKKNFRLKYSKHRGKTLPLKNKSNDTNIVFSTVRPHIKKSRSTKTISTVGNTEFVSREEFGKQHKSQPSDNALNFYKSANIITNSVHKIYNQFKYERAREQSSRERCTNESLASFNGNKCTPRAEKINEKSTLSPLIHTGKKTNIKDMTFKIFEDSIATEQNSEACYDKELIYTDCDESENSTASVNNTMEETLKPFFKSSDDDFRFISAKRHFSNFNYLESFINDSISPKENCGPLNTLKQIISPENSAFLMSEGVYVSEEGVNDDMSAYNDEESSVTSPTYCNDSNTMLSLLNPAAYEGDDETSNNGDEEDVTGTTLYGCETAQNTLPYSKRDATLSEVTQTFSLLEFETDSTDSEKCSFIYNNYNDSSDDLIPETSLLRNGNSTGAAESSSGSDENPFCLTEEESVISAGLARNKSNSPTTDSNALSSKGFSHLTTGISNLTISSGAEWDRATPESKVEGMKAPENDMNRKDKENNSVFIDLRNVTTKRRHPLNNRYQKRLSDADESLPRGNPPQEIPKTRDRHSERDWGSSDSLDHSTMTNKTTIDWNKTLCFANPMFESTRVQDISADAGKSEKAPNQSQKMSPSLLGDSHIWLDHSYALKPGKKWLRSLSVLKQIRNGNLTGDHLESTRIKGRKFESFVKDMLEMQSVLGQSGWSNSVADLSNNASPDLGPKKSLSRSVSTFCGDSLKDLTFKGSDFSLNCSDGTMLETSLINPTIKMIHPEEKPSAFGLKVSNLTIQGEHSNAGKVSGMSGRDFVLLQCGQEDVLPFEEYFNESTLKDCKKIGEGVYGEVFKSSDIVIKIIPIEGSERVNGEPQKTFEEILSEVVIALKLSNLRNGDENRTDGFSEVKRCWCVKGKYPDYLLRLWDEYDQSGSGSENDSPIMFDDDQLYVILELADGGKDLESFVFSSAAQSLSVFAQTALSLAAAEKAFEFEHRDMHWGNILISETKDKFVSVVLDDVEHRIPSKGVKVCIIDFTLSRIYHEGFCIFNDLSVDPTLFTSEGDYQFEIYRMMLSEVRNDWSLFRPKTNIFWLHYTLDKMLKMVRYKNKKTKVHKKSERELRILESTVLGYENSVEFALSDALSDTIKRL